MQEAGPYSIHNRWSFRVIKRKLSIEKRPHVGLVLGLVCFNIASNIKTLVYTT